MRMRMRKRLLVGRHIFHLQVIQTPNCGRDLLFILWENVKSCEFNCCQKEINTTTTFNGNRCLCGRTGDIRWPSFLCPVPIKWSDGTIQSSLSFCRSDSFCTFIHEIFFVRSIYCVFLRLCRVMDWSVPFERKVSL